MGLFKKKDEHDPFLDMAEEAASLPRGDEDLVQQSKKYRRLRVAAQYSPVAAIVAACAAFGSLALIPEQPDPIEPTLTTEGKAVAVSEVQSWLAEKPSPLPQGKFLGWDGYTDVPFPEVNDEEKNKSSYKPPTYSVERHHFSVEGPDNALYRVDVQVAIDESTGPHIIGDPSLMPRPITETDFQPDSPWPGMTDSGNVPDSVNTAIVSWQKAFVSGNSDELRQIVGDQNESHVYLPLAGVESAEVEVTNSAFFTENEDGDDVPGPTMLARVEITPTWASTGASATDQSAQMPVLTYDLLITDAQSGSPKVVAWGGPGEGQELKKYGNAVTGMNDQIVRGDDANGSDDTTGEDSSGDQPGDDVAPLPDGEDSASDADADGNQ
ncbi:hypothetical protein [Brevibacterium sp. FME17]|uniref:hypothetical protein n=1 Tax=Brevibacterium sp. FME17 TaxID=2742606 RepID=UPI00186942A6|nr:hypothetical protein [Brevibacterium sp. FME17]